MFDWTVISMHCAIFFLMSCFLNLYPYLSLSLSYSLSSSNSFSMSRFYIIIILLRILDISCFSRFNHSIIGPYNDLCIYSVQHMYLIFIIKLRFFLQDKLCCGPVLEAQLATGDLYCKAWATLFKQQLTGEHSCKSNCNSIDSWRNRFI